MVYTTYLIQSLCPTGRANARRSPHRDKKIKPAEHLVPSVKKRGCYTSLVLLGSDLLKSPDLMLELSTILTVASCAGKCSLHNRELAAEEICIYKCGEITLRRECHLRVKRMLRAELRVPLFVLRNDPFRSLSECIERHLSWAPVYLDVLEYQTNCLVPLWECSP